MKKLKITFVMFGLGFAGGERIVANLANELVKKGHDITIVVPKNNYLKLYPVKAKVIETFPLKQAPYFEIINSLISLPWKIPKSDFVVAEWCLSVPSVLLATKIMKKGTPLYFIEHFESLFFPKYYIGYPQFVKSTYRHFNHMISLSNWISDEVKKTCGKRPFVTNPGIEQELFRPVKVRKDSKIKKILCLSRQEFWKGNQDLVKAMEIVYKKRKDAKLVMIGARKIKVETNIPYELKQIKHEKFPEEYASSDIFIQPSWYEGFGQTPLEAMACKCPVITTNGGGPLDYAKNNENCLVVPPRNPEKMAEAILKLLDDKKMQEKFIKNGLKTAKAFTYKKMAEEWEQILNNILKKEKVK